MSVVLDDRFMTLKEVAQYLHLNQRTVYKWAQEGKIPGSKLGSTWRFRRSEIDFWVEQHKNARLSSGVEEKG
jgi:excisionase family DNA binding protein